MVCNFSDDCEGLYSEVGCEMVLVLFDYVCVWLVGFQEDSGYFYNLEVMFVEGIIYCFVCEDCKCYLCIFQVGMLEVFYYINFL